MSELQTVPMPRGWREVLAPHPACQLFRRIMPDAGLDALAEDIRIHGLFYPATAATVDGIFYLIDGSRRLDALERLGYELVDHNGKFLRASQLGLPRPFEDRVDIILENVGSIDDPVGLVVSLYVVRRHSSLKERREHARELIKLKPELSNRAIADVVRLDHVTVGVQRRTLEETGEIQQLPKRVGRDGKIRPSHSTTKPLKHEIGVSATGSVAQPETAELPCSPGEQIQPPPPQSFGDAIPPSVVSAEVVPIAQLIDVLRLLDYPRGETSTNLAERLAIASGPYGDREITRIGDGEIIRLLENSCLTLKDARQAFDHREKWRAATRPVAGSSPGGASSNAPTLDAQPNA
jgi:hypothetical protein